MKQKRRRDDMTTRFVAFRSGFFVLGIALLGLVLVAPVGWAQNTPISQILGCFTDKKPEDLPDMLRRWDEKAQEALDEIFSKAGLGLEELINTALPTDKLDTLMAVLNNPTDLDSKIGSLVADITEKIKDKGKPLETTIQSALAKLELPLPFNLASLAKEATKILLDKVYTWIERKEDGSIREIKGFAEEVTSRLSRASADLQSKLKTELLALQQKIEEGKISAAEKSSALLKTIQATVKDTLTRKITEPLGQVLKEALEVLKFEVPTEVVPSEKKRLEVPGFKNLGLKIEKWFVSFVGDSDKGNCRFEFSLVGSIFLPGSILQPEGKPTSEELDLPFGLKASLDLKGNFQFERFFTDPSKLSKEQLFSGKESLNDKRSELEDKKQKLEMWVKDKTEEVAGQVNEQIKRLKEVIEEIDSLIKKFEDLKDKIPEKVNIAGTGFKIKLKEALEGLLLFLPSASDFWPPAAASCPDDPKDLAEIRACIEQKVFKESKNFPGKDWKGFFIKKLKLILPEEFELSDDLLDNDKVAAQQELENALELKNFVISELGFSGRLNLTAALAKLKQRFQDKLEDGFGLFKLGGLKADITGFELTFLNNVPDGSTITVDICIPKTDCRQPENRITVTFHFNLDGSWSVKAQVAEPGKTICFKSCDGNKYVQLILKQLEFGYEPTQKGAFFGADGKLSVEVGRSIFGDALMCPDSKNASTCKGVDFKGLKMLYSKEKQKFLFKLKSAWIELTKFAEQKMEDAESKFSSKFAIRRVGFGNNEGSDDFTEGGWVGLGGEFNLGEAIGVRGRLDDLQIKWGMGASGIFSLGNDVYLDISRIGIEINKPYLQLKGFVSVKGDGFEGTADGVIPPLRVAFGATVKLGKTDKNESSASVCKPSGGGKYQYWYFDIKAELPTGTPLATDISLYGLAGGAGNNVYMGGVQLDPTTGQVKAETFLPPKTCKGNFAIKFGVTLGTTHDNGFSVTADTELIIQTSGPVITLAGKGWINQNRFERFQVPPTLDLKIVYDNSQPLFLMYVAGFYKIQGKTTDKADVPSLTLVKLTGSFEMLFSPPEWHIFFGQKPKPKRIRAEILELGINADKYFVKADTYLMIGNKVPFPVGGGETPLPGVLLGASLEYGDEIDAKVVVIYYQLWASGDLAMSWRPRQIWVSFGLGGRAGFKIFGIGLGVNLAAKAEGQYPNPAQLAAGFKIGVDLPWPLGDFNFEFERKWPEQPVASEDPSFEQPIRSAELLTAQGNRPAQEDGTGLCNNATTLGPDGKPVDCKNKPITQAKLLNPRIVLNFHRPMDATPPPPGSPPATIHGDGRDLDGKFGNIFDQVGRYQVQYRLTDVRLEALGSNSSCPISSDVDRPDEPLSVFWGSLHQIRPTPIGPDVLANEAKSKEAELLVSQPGVGKNDTLDATKGRLARERIRQILTVQPAPPSANCTKDKCIVNEVPQFINCARSVHGLGGQQGNPVCVVDYPAPPPPSALKPNQTYLLEAKVWWQATRLYSTKDSTKLPEDGQTITFCFRTGSEPTGKQGLTPYVAWTNPTNNALNAFWGEDVMTLFNTAGMQSAFGKGDKPLQLALYDQNGKLVASSTTAKLKGQVLTLPATVTVMSGEPPLVLFLNLLQPRSRYFVKVLRPDADPKNAKTGQIMFEYQFSTSEFSSFEKLMTDKATKFGGSGISGVKLSGSDKDHQLKDADAKAEKLPVQVGSNYIVLKTKEALPWGQAGRVRVSLSKGASPIPLKRLTPNAETTQVFVPVDPAKFTSGSYTLTIEYRGGLVRDQIPSLLWAETDEKFSDGSSDIDLVNLKSELKPLSDNLVKKVTITFTKS